MSSAVLDLSVLGEAFDQPPPTNGERRLLFICTSPRSGSHRLCRALYDLGIGVPEEYFHRTAIDRLGARWRVEEAPESPEWLNCYWAALQRHRNRNGVVAISLFGTQINTLMRLIRPADRPVFIHLYRRSTADQVASLLALYETRMPYDNEQQVMDIPGITEVSPRSIRILQQWVRLQNTKWRQFLAAKPHISVASEDFFVRPGEILTRILSHAGWDCPPALVETTAQTVAQSQAYPINSMIKQKLMENHAASFAAIAGEE